MELIEGIITNLNEKFFISTESRYGDYIEIFKNPKMDEIKSIATKRDRYKSVRFFIEKNRRTIYIWNPEAIHKDVAIEFGYSFEEMKNKNLAGVAILQGSKLIFGHSNIATIDKYRRRELSEEILNGEYDFMEMYYFDLDPMKVDCQNFLDKGEFNFKQVGV